jgi:pimeloyl-ACP methyl ester carboxylesterase
MPLVKSNGTEIYFEERGEGEPLVLIMGLGADGSLWEEHVKAYEKHFRCILMDNRGAGRSGKPVGPYSTLMMADDAIGVMDALKIQNAHISGISMGGAIAQEIALKCPERVRSITLVSTWSKCDAYTSRIFEMFKSLIQTSDPVAFGRMLQLWIFSARYHENHMDDLLRREGQNLSSPYPMPVHAFMAQCDACISHDTLDRLDSIKIPALIAVGDEDIFTPIHFSQDIVKKIRNSELYMIKGSGHTHHWEKLDEFNKKTLSFMLMN